MKILRYISFISALLALGACSEDSLAPQGPEPDLGDKFALTVSVKAPAMAQVSSRAMGETPDYASLKLYLIEFEMKNQDDPTANFMRKIYEATDEKPGTDIVEFKVELAKSEEPRVLHLVAVPKGTSLMVGDKSLLAGDVYGSEAIMGQVTPSGGAEAYWQRLKFLAGYGTETVTAEGEHIWVTSQDTKDKLQRVPMIRNFAQIRVAVDPAASDDFVLEGFAMTNTPKIGSIAPWDKEHYKFPEYLSAGNTQKPYAELASYPGIFPGDESADLDNKTADVLAFTADPKFIYERPASSVNPTALIIKGRYNGSTVSSYYKINLGALDTDHKFNYYNLLRNFRFNVTIKGVSSEGYPTAQAAMRGVVYNNLSFDVDTEQMLNISDGKAMLWVNFTSHVVTTEESRTVYFGYKLKPDLSADRYSDATIIRDSGTNGQVIESMTPVTDVNSLPDDIKNMSDVANWRFYEIRTVSPSSERKKETFIVIDQASGVARTVTLICRTPWRVWRNRVFAGNYNKRDEFPYGFETRLENKVHSGTGQPLTVFFVIPDNLDKAIFPLSFVIESDRQDIENNPVGTLVVKSGKSLFDNTKTAIQYVKTITWTDYNTRLTDENPTGTIVTDADNATPIRRIRCRFRTINSVTASTESKVRISNPYFELQDENFKTVNGGTVEVKFTRNPSADADILKAIEDNAADKNKS